MSTEQIFAGATDEQLKCTYAHGHGHSSKKMHPVTQLTMPSTTSFKPSMLEAVVKVSGSYLQDQTNVVKPHYLAMGLHKVESWITLEQTIATCAKVIHVEAIGKMPSL